MYMFTKCTYNVISVRVTTENAMGIYTIIENIIRANLCERRKLAAVSKNTVENSY